MTIKIWLEKVNIIPASLQYANDFLYTEKLLALTNDFLKETKYINLIKQPYIIEQRASSLGKLDIDWAYVSFHMYLDQSLIKWVEKKLILDMKTLGPIK